MSVRLEELLARKVTVQWHEAVAIVLELCEIVEGPSGPKAPNLADIEITAAGGVRLLPGDPGDENPVTRLGRILHTVLPETGIPPPLRVVTSHAASPQPLYNSVSDFARALEYFERPDRMLQIRSVYGRWQTLPPPAEETVASVELWKPPPPPPVPKAPRRRKFVFAAAAVALLALVPSLAWLATRPESKERLASWRGQVAALFSSGTDTVARQVEAGVSAVRSRVQPGRGIETPPPEPAAAETPAPAVTAATRRKPVEERLSEGEAVLAMPAFSVFDLEALGPSSRRLLVPEPTMTIAEAEASAEEEPAGPIYSGDDSEVIPPVALHPKMPAVLPPGVRQDSLGVMTLVISETGEVESVKLNMPVRRMIDIMTLSAAKTWRFAPALKDGKPVRYRKLIWIAVS
jgi:hypothetical protein